MEWRVFCVFCVFRGLFILKIKANIDFYLKLYYKIIYEINKTVQ